MVLSNLAMPGHPADLINGRAWAYCICSRYGRGLFGHSFLFSISLSLENGPI